MASATKSFRAIYNTRLFDAGHIMSQQRIEPTARSNRTFVEGPYEVGSLRYTCAKDRGRIETIRVAGAQEAEVGIEFEMDPSEIAPESRATWSFVIGPIFLNGRNPVVFTRRTP